ncbi:MAG: 4-hydroxy-tetrahydrodipicolinate reductase [Bacteroidales bacterium]
MDRKINIALIGYGKMGQEIEKMAVARGHHIQVIIDREEDWIDYQPSLSKAEVAIEFTTPTSAPANIERCFKAGIPVVTGTTGWHSQLPHLEQACRQYDGTLFHASNFSLGVNLFFELNRKLAELMAGYKEYSPRLNEIHHLQKLDAPSGTAVSLANDLVAIHPQLSGWELTEAPAENVLAVRAQRIQHVTGTHSVAYEGADDCIEITHTAHNRNGFVKGALTAALWVMGKKGIFTMKDLLKF